MDKVIEMKDMLAEIYYGLWANMISWPLIQRAAVVLFFAILFLGLFLRFGGLVLGKLLQKFGKGFVKILFGIWQLAMPVPRNAGSQNERIYKMNETTEKFSKLVDKIHRIGNKLIKFHGLKIKYYLVIYVICILAISIPELLKDKVNEPYLGRLAFGQTIYCSLESGVIEKARDYDPFLALKEKESPDNAESEEDNMQSDGFGLRLSEEGKQGSYLRMGPGTEYDSIAVLSGDIYLRYIDEADQWINVETQDGTSGWINRKLVEAAEQ